jgi:lipopolysaccharide transport system ATP-binding protein
MYVRLAFAVAAHLEPEILLVDEVLAVGDAEFQKKCLGKMSEVAGEGKTVLFVSHNMAVINQLCGTSLLLRNGYLKELGPTNQVIDHYLSRDGGQPGTEFDLASDHIPRVGSGIGRLTNLKIEGQRKVSANSIGIGEPFLITIRAQAFQRMARVVFGVEIFSQIGIQLYNLRSDSQGQVFGPFQPGDNIIMTIAVPGLPLYPSLYILKPWFGQKGGYRIDHLVDGISLSIESLGVYDSEQFIQGGRGLILIDCDWRVEVE